MNRTFRTLFVGGPLDGELKDIPTSLPGPGAWPPATLEVHIDGGAPCLYNLIEDIGGGEPWELLGVQAVEGT